MSEWMAGWGGGCGCGSGGGGATRSDQWKRQEKNDSAVPGFRGPSALNELIPHRR